MKNCKLLKGFQKIAFAHQQDHPSSHKSFGEQMSTVAKHPVSFLGSALKGEAAGLAGGAVGGALVAAPLAAYWARKGNSERVFKAGKGIFKSIHPSSPSYSGRLAHHLFELGKGETVGGGVLGLGLGMSNFFKKYKDEK